MNPQIRWMALFVAGAICLVGCGQSYPTTSQGKLNKALAELKAASSPAERYYALNDAAKESFVLGKVEDARKYADELLTLSTSHTRDWNYGNAIHDGHMVLGRIALQENKVEEARQHLLKAGGTPGSPQLNSFGPNVSLAKDLLDKGEREAVLKYFELCRAFWRMGQKQLDEWTEQVKDGKVPNFGPNLVY